ncbi:MAG TPA: alpha-ketoglutarate-dependent dioxygenase AlkB [Steroidobacteraceae bacterium]|nr:alpha-ketoglutarate-dependent dioxygenase AlkB [Steroidobacteraceae bacterium]
MLRNPDQSDLFASSAALPDGLRYRADLLSVEHEQELLERFAALHFKQALYKEYTAKRRVVNYGAGYDFVNNEVTAAPAIPDFLWPLRDQLALWIGIDADQFVQALLSEYQPGTPLGWHRDVPEYELIAGVSLASAARMRFRPYPPRADKREGAFALELAPRSAYVMTRAARWEWQHSVPPTPGLRYSITFRTKRREG